MTRCLLTAAGIVLENRGCDDPYIAMCQWRDLSKSCSEENYLTCHSWKAHYNETSGKVEPVIYS